MLYTSNSSSNSSSRSSTTTSSRSSSSRMGTGSSSSSSIKGGKMNTIRKYLVSRTKLSPIPLEWQLCHKFLFLALPTFMILMFVIYAVDTFNWSQ